MKKNYIYAFLTVIIWGTTALIAKAILTNIPDLETLAYSSIFACLFFVIFNSINGSIKELNKYSFKDYSIMAGLGFLGLFLYSAFYYYGISELTSQEACIINYLWPIMLVLFSCILLKEKMTIKKIIALLMSFIGIVVLVSGNHIISDSYAFIGVVSCILAAACYGLFSVLNKKYDYNQNISMMVVWVITLVCSFIGGLLTEQWVVVEGMQWLGLIWLGVVTDAIAYLLWALALKDIENSAVIANMAYLVPFISIVLSAVFLKEKITVNVIFALVLIVGGILFQSINLKR